MTTTEQLRQTPRMRLHFNVHDPVELVEMTLAFQGLGFDYHRFLKARFADSEARANLGEVKLYITRIESNCILAELAPALPLLGALVPAMADINVVYDFVKHVGDTIRWLQAVSGAGSVASEDVPYSKRRLSHMRDVVRLVARGKDANLGLAAIRYEETSGDDKALLELTFTDAQCRAAEHGATLALAALECREKADHEKVLMYFFQTNTDDPKAGGRTGDKALIDSISPDPLSVYIIPETDQQKVRYVLDDKEHNPLRTGFVVDVNVEKDRSGRPRVYRVVKLHEIIPD